MVAVRQTSFLQKNRISRDLLSLPKSRHPISNYSGKQPLGDKDLNDRVAVRFFVKRSRRSNDLSASMLIMMQQLKSASRTIDERMKRKGFSKNPSFILGPKVPSSPEDPEKFVLPKHYVCEGCNAKQFSLSAYIKHLRNKHNVNIRCSGCSRCFDHVIDKRRHEMRCPKKIKLRI